MALLLTETYAVVFSVCGFGLDGYGQERRVRGVSVFLGPCAEGVCDFNVLGFSV